MTTELEAQVVQSVEIKREVRDFYDSIGWQQVGEGLYQNARYEDLRPVSRQYLHRCHLRVLRHLPPSGKLLLDAGSGPIQYPEYLEYSRGFAHRVCLDISIRALREARNRIGSHGLYVVGDLARLPFPSGVFEGLVSLHAVHHLPPQDHERAMRLMYQTLCPGGKAVVVYSWGQRSLLMRLFKPAVQLAVVAIKLYRRMLNREGPDELHAPEDRTAADRRQGTYTFRYGYRWVREQLGDLPGFEIRVWRSVSTGVLRALIHRRLLGAMWLRMLYWMEERLPHAFGRWGQYPMILFHKPGGQINSEGSAD